MDSSLSIRISTESKDYIKIGVVYMNDNNEKFMKKKAGAVFSPKQKAKFRPSLRSILHSCKRQSILRKRNAIFFPPRRLWPL